MKRVLLILAQQNYHDVEYAGTRKGLEGAQCSIVVGSTSATLCHGKLGGSEQATIALKDVDIMQFDCIAFIGGSGAREYIENSDALRIAHEAVRVSKPLGAICIAPLILAKARVLDGRRATVWNGNGEPQKELEKNGAQYTGDSVTVDGMIVTANGSDAAEEFGRTLASLLV
ncbi:MAG: DJ-1/PfpI family protein [Candidatus Peribacteraceae bacterium]|jgi:protease I